MVRNKGQNGGHSSEEYLRYGMNGGCGNPLILEVVYNQTQQVVWLRWCFKANISPYAWRENINKFTRSPTTGMSQFKAAVCTIWRKGKWERKEKSTFSYNQNTMRRSDRFKLRWNKVVWYFILAMTQYLGFNAGSSDKNLYQKNNFHKFYTFDYPVLVYPIKSF